MDYLLPIFFNLPKLIYIPLSSVKNSSKASHKYMLATYLTVENQREPHRLKALPT
jgi:hypothetical protein